MSEEQNESNAVAQVEIIDPIDNKKSPLSKKYLKIFIVSIIILTLIISSSVIYLFQKRGTIVAPVQITSSDNNLISQVEISPTFTTQVANIKNDDVCDAPAKTIELQLNYLNLEVCSIYFPGSKFSYEHIYGFNKTADMRDTDNLLNSLSIRFLKPDINIHPEGDPIVQFDLSKGPLVSIFGENVESEMFIIKTSDSKAYVAIEWNYKDLIIRATNEQKVNDPQLSLNHPFVKQFNGFYLKKMSDFTGCLEDYKKFDDDYLSFCYPNDFDIKTNEVVSSEQNDGRIKLSKVILLESPSIQTLIKSNFQGGWGTPDSSPDECPDVEEKSFLAGESVNRYHALHLKNGTGSGCFMSEVILPLSTQDKPSYTIIHSLKDTKKDYYHLSAFRHEPFERSLVIKKLP